MRSDLTEYNKDKIKDIIVCPYCRTNNIFSLYETETGVMAFKCHLCSGFIQSSFKRRKDEVI